MCHHWFEPDPRVVQRRVEREQREERRRALRLVREPLHQHAADDRDQAPAQPTARVSLSPSASTTAARRASRPSELWTGMGGPCPALTFQYGSSPDPPRLTHLSRSLLTT